ncbi:MAG: DUF5715 family protein [Bacteroidales bacterium]|nr:DUF5715 family protein [Bacteroidales bacterium]
MSARTKLYIDINGTLIDKRKQRPVAFVSEFVDYILQNFDCYWLSPECCCQTEETRIHLSRFFDADIVEKLITFHPTYWTTSKTNAIDFSEDFIWIDSYIFGYEHDVLKRNHKADHLILVKTEAQTLLDTIGQIKRLSASFHSQPAEQPMPKRFESMSYESETNTATTEVDNNQAEKRTVTTPSIIIKLNNAMHRLKQKVKALKLPQFSQIKTIFTPKSRLTAKTKKQLTWLCVAIAALLVVVIVATALHHKIVEESWEGMEELVDYTNYKGVFNDVQDVQEPVARAIGLPAVETRAAGDSIFPERVSQGKMVEIKENKYYVVDELTHSHPYAIPQVSVFLDTLGARIQRKANGSDSRFLITSITRTVEDVKKLQGVNSLATRNSCHLFGTTIDIQYTEDSFVQGKRPISGHNAQILLFQTLKEMREEGWCFVKYEAPNGVCHITIRK